MRSETDQSVVLKHLNPGLRNRVTLLESNEPTENAADIYPVSHALVLFVESDNTVMTVLNEDADLPFYNLPGGHTHPGETPRQTVKREIHEELGLDVSDKQLSFIGIIHEGDTQIPLFVAAVTKLELENAHKPTDSVRLGQIPLETLLAEVQITLTRSRTNDLR